MKVGRRLANKLLNAARFVLSFELTEANPAVTEPLDQSMLTALADVVEQSTRAFEAYDHTRALELTETFFWGFTDDYLELVKERAYGQANATEASRNSAVLALRIALGGLVRLLAPFIPFAAEEVWSWWQQGSVHRSSWPVAEEFRQPAEAAVLPKAAAALMLIRKSKSDAKLSMKAGIDRAVITAPASDLAVLESCKQDLMAAGRVQQLEFIAGQELNLTDLEFASE
jgi:valyl-tRNA synthetase